MSEFLSTLLQAVLIAAVPVCATFIGKSLSALAQYIHKKAEIEAGWKYAADVTAAISTAVTYVSQTYVDGLKKSDKFTKENQEKALQTAIDKAKAMLTEEVRSFIETAYGDLNGYLASLIEAEVRNQKQGFISLAS